MISCSLRHISVRGSTYPAPKIVLSWFCYSSAVLLPPPCLKSATRHLHVGLHNTNREAAHNRAWNATCMSDFLFSSVFLEESARKWESVCVQAPQRLVHARSFLCLAGEQFLSMLFQVMELSCELCSAAHAEGGLLNSYQSFLSHLMVQLNPLTTLFKIFRVNGESLDEGQGKLAAECGRENEKAQPLFHLRLKKQRRDSVERFCILPNSCPSASKDPCKHLLFVRCCSGLFLLTQAVIYSDQCCSALLTHGSS